MKNDNPLESVIQTATFKYARERGMLAYKLTTPQHNGIPDGLLISPTGVIAMPEFKRRGLKPTPAQLREHQRLKDHCVMVFVIDSIEQGRYLVDLLMGEVK